MSCILRYRGVQLILAYSRARPAILAAGKGRGGMFCFFCFFTFIHFPLSFSFSSPLLSLLSLFSLSSKSDTNDSQALTCRSIPTQSNPVKYLLLYSSIYIFEGMGALAFQAFVNVSSLIMQKKIKPSNYLLVCCCTNKQLKIRQAGTLLFRGPEQQ